MTGTKMFLFDIIIIINIIIIVDFYYFLTELNQNIFSSFVIY